jgi:CubicO group peptidase (beta-lactamase class C family)
MSAGFPSDDPWADRYMDLDRAAVDAMFARVPTFSTAPGTTFEYSNLGWVMVGRALSNILGQPVQRFVSERMLAPLGMWSTTWDVPDPTARLFGHRWRDSRWQEEAEPLADGDWAPMAGLWSTVADLARWMSFFMDALPARNDADDALLARSSRREMQTIHRVAEPDDPPGAPAVAGYGYGLWVEHDETLGRVVGHRGGLPGFGSHMRWLPDRRIGVVALANATYAPMHGATLAVLGRLRDVGILPEERTLGPSDPLRAAREVLIRLLDSWDDAVAEEAFSMNVALDEPLDRRREAAAAVRQRLGSVAAGDVRPSSSTSGSFDLQGDRGRCTVEVTLTPEIPPRIATYAFRFEQDA